MLALLLVCTFLGAKIEIGKSLLEVEIADTFSSKEKGLSGRESLPEGTGMLFMYSPPQTARFWMKDMKFPITIGFFDENRILVQWVDMLPSSKQPLPLYTSPPRMAYALEVPIGWFRRNEIRPGAKFSFLDHAN